MGYASARYHVEVFYDGACPLCYREMRLIQRMDKKGVVRCTDISNSDFDRESIDVSWENLMKRIHGRLADGSIVEGVEVFRVIYSAIGLRYLVLLTRLPGLSHILDVGYRLFAKNRLRMTGRSESCDCDK
tara:strand:+ start:874 stop:1263 length:390 start_codon:yes stop_codon:yes gene_type:complete